ncbi:hypothetical protein LCGC14_1266320 [marine sediment metagenome]|uniref:Uncharacterized protein n=1 Tax=marine sediment metagenome TaxID=412755 RepID=A0A0F9KZD8_9ZZZZ
MVKLNNKKKQYIDNLCDLLWQHIDECGSCRIYDDGWFAACSMGSALSYLIGYNTGVLKFNST